MASVPAWLSLYFLLLVGVMYSVLIIGARYANNVTKATSIWSILVLRLLLGGWILATGLLAINGWFLDFSSFPPKIVIAAVVMMITMVAFALSPLMGRWLAALSQKSIIATQSFRIFVEIALFYLAQTPLLPKLMTPEGRNFDVLVGLTAPIMAFVAHKKSQAPWIGKAILAWNIIGIGLLINVVAHGILSTPTPMQKIFVEPPNTALGYFPFAWLPAFLVPLALFLHILSIRKLRAKG